MSRDTFELVFKHSGGVELRSVVDGDEDDTVVWASDSDQDFMDEFGNEIMSGADDAEQVLDYLEKAEIIDEEEAGEIEIFDESLDGSEIVPDADSADIDDDADDWDNDEDEG